MLVPLIEEHAEWDQFSLSSLVEYLSLLYGIVKSEISSVHGI